MFPLFNLRHPRDFKSSTTLRGTLYYYVRVKLAVSGIHLFPLLAEGIFSRSRLRGSQETRLYTTVQARASARLRGACSGRSKSRSLASNHGIAFQPARANQAHAIYNTAFSFFFSISGAVFEVPQQPSKARQPRYNSHASSFFLCHELCFCV